MEKMVARVYLHGSRQNSCGQLSLPIESSAVVFVLRYCNASRFRIVLVGCKTDDHTGISVPACSITDFAELSSVEIGELPVDVAGCRLPAVVSDGDNVVRSGLCSTIRHIISQVHQARPDDHLDDLLGFRGGTLKACAEVSGWTKLCELELPLSVVEFQKFRSDSGSLWVCEEEQCDVAVPTELQRLDEHLNKPALHHNDNKKKGEILTKLRSMCRELSGNTTCSTENNPSISVQKLLEGGNMNGQIMNLLQQEFVKPHCVVQYKILRKFDELTSVAIMRKKKKKKCSESRKERVAAAAAVRAKQSGDVPIIRSTAISEDFCPSCQGQRRQTGLVTAQKPDHLFIHVCHCEQSDSKPLINSAQVEECHNEKMGTSGPSSYEVIKNSEQQITSGFEQLTLEHDLDHKQNKPRNCDTEQLEYAAAFSEKILNFVNSLSVDDIELDHRYAEGMYLTVADLILFVFVYYFMDGANAKGLSFSDACPHLVTWFSHLTSLPRVQQTASGCGFHIEIGDISTATHGPTRQMKFIRPALGDSNEEPAELSNHSNSKCRALKPDVADALRKIQRANIIPHIGEHPCGESVRVDWNSLPAEVHPLEGNLPEKRVRRKCEQLENLVTAIVKIAKPGQVIVDFCCGGGHLGIVIAYLLPDCKVYLIENKEESLLRAKQRVDKLLLTNVTLFQCNLEYFHGQFDVGVCLHGCGVATDMVLQQCLDTMAAFVVCPCCYGKVQNTHLITYPRSQTFKKAQLSSKDYIILGHAADQTEIGIELEQQGKLCSNLVDTDRGLLFKQHGYMVTLCSLHPLSCTPKNNLLIGIPPQDNTVR